MADTLTKAERSALMSRIRGTNTKPEVLVRSALHRAGFRFRLYSRGLPGRPDIVLPKHGAVVFIHGGGDFIDFTLGPGEMLQVDTGCVVGFEESVSYDIQFVGGIKTAIFGGEGLFLATLTGPGRVIVQSMTLEKLRRELAPGQSGGDEKSPLGAIGGLFGSED